MDTNTGAKRDESQAKAKAQRQDGPRRGVIKTDRLAASAFNGVGATVLRDITEADGAAFNDKTPQVLAQVGGREFYFYADEIDLGDDKFEKAKVIPEFIPDRLRHPATADQAAWDAADRQSTVQAMEQYLLAYPMGTHAQEARLRRSQIGPGLPPLPPLPPAMTDAMAAQAPVVAKDEDRNTPVSGNHPEYDVTEDQRRNRPQGLQGIGQTQLGQQNQQGRQQPAADEDAAWRNASQTDTVWAYDDYAARFPDGPHANEAKRRRQAIAG